MHGQTERTTRRYHVLQYRTLPAALPAAAMPQLDYTPPAETTPAVRYVPAVDPRTRAAALEWVWGLLDDNNQLSPSRVLGPHTKAPGQVQAPKPRAEVLQLLTDLKIVREGEGKMLFWCSPYPTIMETMDVIQGRGVQR